MVFMEAWRIGFDERSPIYLQIINEFCRSVVKGELKPGDRIPSIRDLAVILKVNTNTIQRAYREMEGQGLIYSQRGMGYFLVDDENMTKKVKSEMVQESTMRFIEELRALGFSDGQIMKELESQLKGEKTDHESDGNKTN